MPIHKFTNISGKRSLTVAALMGASQFGSEPRPGYPLGRERSLAMRFISNTAHLAALMSLASYGFGQPTYDLLLQGGHVVDPKNGISAVRDVAIKDGFIAAVAAHLDPAAALKVVNVAGLYVTPGLVDIHAHLFTGTGERGSYAGDLSLSPDGFTFRVGVTTVADAGCAGWRNFEDFKDRIVDRSKTRVLERSMM